MFVRRPIDLVVKPASTAGLNAGINVLTRVTVAAANRRYAFLAFTQRSVSL